MPTTPEQINRQALLPLITALGLVPEEIRQLTITPFDVTVDAYRHTEVPADEAVITTIRIPITGE